MDVRLIAGTLRRCPLFERFDVPSLGKLAQLVECRHFQSGQILFRALDEGASLFVLSSGQVEFFIENQTQLRVVGGCGPVRSFGELSLLLPGPRMIGARAVDEASLFEMSSGLLKMLELSDPSLALELIAAVRERAAAGLSTQRHLFHALFVRALEEIGDGELSRL